MYENLVRVVKEMGACNGFGIRPVDEWPDVSNRFSILQLEMQASRVEDGDEMLEFVDGEADEIIKLVEDKGLHQLNRFLNEVFDGDYHADIAYRDTHFKFMPIK